MQPWWFVAATVTCELAEGSTCIDDAHGDMSDEMLVLALQVMKRWARSSYSQYSRVAVS